jgi:hypothetical protein
MKLHPDVSRDEQAFLQQQAAALGTDVAHFVLDALPFQSASARPRSSKSSLDRRQACKKMRFTLKRLLLLTTLVCVTAAIVGARGMVGVGFAWWFWSAIVGVVAFRSRRAISVVLALVMFLGGLLLVPITFSEGHPVPLRRLSHIQPGMTEHQVQGVLGMPSSVKGNQWFYESQWTWCYISIAFTSGGRVQEVVHDH